MVIAKLPEVVLPSVHGPEELKSSAMTRAPYWGRVSKVGVNAWVGVGKGVKVAVGGNQTTVGVGVLVGGSGVAVGSGGSGVGACRQEANPRVINSSAARVIAFIMK